MRRGARARRLVNDAGSGGGHPWSTRVSIHIAEDSESRVIYSHRTLVREIIRLAFPKSTHSALGKRAAHRTYTEAYADQSAIP